MANTDSKTRIIAVGNQKGGVGKTTNTVHIATALGELGRQSLIWDLDMNHGATRHFGIAAKAYLGSYEVLIGAETPENVIMDGSDQEIEMPKGVHLLPANRKLEQIDDTLASKNKFIIRHHVLIEPLKNLRGKYDYIFLDTAPNATTPDNSSLLCGGVVPADRYSRPVRHRRIERRAAGHRKRYESTETRPRGPRGSAVNRQSTHSTRQSARRVCRADLHATKRVVSEVQDRDWALNHHSNGPEARKTVFQTEPTHKVTEQYRELAREFEAQFEQLPATRGRASWHRRWPTLRAGSKAMAKRAPEEEREFNPIQATLIQAAVGPAPTSSQLLDRRNPGRGG